MSPVRLIAGPTLTLGLMAGSGAAPDCAAKPGTRGKIVPLPYRDFAGGASKGWPSVLKTSKRE